MICATLLFKVKALLNNIFLIVSWFDDFRTWWTSAFVVEGIDSLASSAVLARRRAARYVLIFTILARVTNVAITPVQKEKKLH